MANEYIRREDVLKGKKTGTFANGTCLVAEPCVTVGYIESLKPADVAPVVRCKDCKNWSREDYGYCFVHASYGMAHDDFCSYGERRGEQDGK